LKIEGREEEKNFKAFKKQKRKGEKKGVKKKNNSNSD